LSRLRNSLTEANEVAEWINHSCLQGSPWRGFESQGAYSDTLRGDLVVKGPDAFHHYTEPSTGIAVTMVFAQMQDEITPRYLPIEWKIWLIAVIPIDGESEKALIELICLRDVEDAKNRYDPIEAYFHDHTPLATAHFDAE
jgi:hypothetical protein